MIPFPQLAAWIQDRVGDAEDPFLAGAQEIVRRFLERDQLLPNRRQWNFLTVDAFRDLAARVRTPEQRNDLYWNDQVETVEAYSYTTYLRMADLVRPAVRALNAEEYAPAAVLGRALLELGSSYLWNANILLKAAEELRLSPGTVTISQEFEQFIVGAMWGTRLKNLHENPQTRNVLTTIQKLSKSREAKDLYPHYEYLCEIAHPNVIGNARYWSTIESKDEFGAERRVIERRSATAVASEIFMHTLWAVSCACNMGSNSYEMLVRASDLVRAKLRGTQ